MKRDIHIHVKIDLILYSSSADKNRPIDRRAKGYRDSLENDIPKDGESIRSPFARTFSFNKGN